MAIGRSSFKFVGGTLLSRVSGLVRDQVILGAFGATALQDAFVVAFRIPNLLRDMVAEGALGNAFTKVYSQLAAEDTDRAERLLIQSLQFVSIVGGLICLLGIVLAPQLVDLMTMFSKATGSHANSSEFLQNTVGLTRLLFPYLGLTIVGAIVAGALHQKGLFFLSAISPVAFNLGNIIGALVFARWLTLYGPEWIEKVFAHPGITGLAVGVLLGGLAQVLVQLVGIWKPLLSGRPLWPRVFPWSKDIKHVMVLMFPAAVAASSAPINAMINTNFAIAYGEGTVTYLNYAFRLLQLPIGLFAVAISVASLPALSRTIAAARGVVDAKASKQFQYGIELALWLLVPSWIFIAVNNLALIELLYNFANFTKQDGANTALALAAYAFGLIGYGLIKVLTSFYYAVERTSYAMKVSLGSIAVNLAGNSLAWAQGWPFWSLAATGAAAFSINALVLIVGLRRHKIAWQWQDFSRSAFGLAAAGLLSFGAGNAWYGWLGGSSGATEWYASATKLDATMALTVHGAALAIIFAIAAAWRWGFRKPRFLVGRRD